MTVLQVALDVMQLGRAVAIAREAVDGGADWIEIGTPLLKSEGAEAIRAIRRAFPGATLVADTKTMDTGAFEVEIAAKAGADYATVLGLADDSTISEAVAAGRKYGTEVIVDLINSADPARRAAEAAALGASMVCLHAGIDSQMRSGGVSPEALGAICAGLSIPVAVAGGITAETARAYVEAGAYAVIVGGAIVKAADIRKAAEGVKASMAGAGPGGGLSKKYGEDGLLEAFSKASTCNVSDAFHKRGVVRGLRPFLARGQRMAGRALTVHTAGGDWAKPVEAIDRARPGDVIVIDAGGSEVAVWGELASNSAMTVGAAGVVIDGAIRDIGEIMDLGFPAFARHVAPCAGEPKGYGGIGMEVTVGGQAVRTGDWIVGDENGLVVIPREMAVEVANRTVDVNERECRTREEIRRGSTLSKVNEISKWEPVK
ncbi:MAG: orotidine 5'-phosphate decarboxylase [Candidatus Methanoplasma sp.]|jgi:3-hexulose-6-phosphate synthase/6-phospho-3-hexuloisomerase|nr:orotidine 5'-phosphate decarboxylase [Candidatus Methanoplasma sp.]